MVTQRSVLAWRIPWTEEPGGLRSLGCKESDTTEQLRACYQMYDNSASALCFEFLAPRNVGSQLRNQGTNLSSLH